MKLKNKKNQENDKKKNKKNEDQIWYKLNEIK